MSNFYKFFVLCLSASALVLGTTAVTQHSPEKVEYQWEYLNFTWPSAQVHDEALKNGGYIPENNVMAGIKVWKDRLYLTIPRWKFGVPATLVSIPVNSAKDASSPLLEPFPNWDMQKIGDCSAMQFIQSMEIDPKGRMWVIDTGRVGTIEDSPKNLCPGRLLIFDLENDNKILLNYEFPADVVKRDTAYLNDLVLDHEDGGWAYITDTDSDYPGIVVYSVKDQTSWKVTHQSMHATAVNFRVKVDGTKVDTPLNIDPIALSPASDKGHRFVYFAPLSSLELFAIPTSALKARNVNPDSHIKKLGDKLSQSDGMVMSADGRLYFGQLSLNTVSEWSSKKTPFKDGQVPLFHEDQQMQWPDTFAIDEQNWLWAVSNRLQRLLADNINTNELNIRILRLSKLGVKNYQYYLDGSVPALPAL